MTAYNELIEYWHPWQIETKSGVVDRANSRKEEWIRKMEAKKHELDEILCEFRRFLKGNMYTGSDSD